MRLLLNWLLAALSIGIASYLVPGVSVTIVGALIAALVLGILNTFVRPILFFLTLPITILTLGLFSFVINAFLVLVAAWIVPGFYVASFFSALVFTLLLFCIHFLFHIVRNA